MFVMTGNQNRLLMCDAPGRLDGCASVCGVFKLGALLLPASTISR